ncbi:helix-turn-helix domain-containing protein [Clostridium tepidum]|uniref:helix-turn-helix domain-containing protein n=1 Tax=Clostridium tepidum TaxID=1962263 RepID=UPI001A9AB1C3|nr:helix-turn-helix transcriptional regulator [Clostridium tepidum]
MIGENLQKLRKEKKLSLRALAEKANISKSTLSDIENGKTNPTVTTLEKIAAALEVPLNCLTRKSAKALIEDKLKELNMTFKELSDKTKISITFFDNLDDIIPDEGDYEKIQVIANALNIEPIELLNALHSQEPTIYDWSKFDKKYPNLKEEVELFETGEFTTAQAAMQFILKQPAIMGFGGFDVNKMTDEDVVEFANELLNLLKMLGPKYNK